jgi:hypothetical protein
MYIGLHVKYRLFFQIFIRPEFSRQIFEKNTHTSNFMKICPVEARFVNADGERDRLADMKRPIVAFHSFVKAPKKIMENVIQ